MVLGRKTIFLLGKTKNTKKKTIFRDTMRPDTKKMFFGVFPRKKMVLSKTNFVLGKRWFWTGKPTFSWGKNGFGQENQLFPGEKMVWA